MGNPCHQVGAGTLVSGIFFPLTEQVLLHMFKGGTHRGEFILPFVVHRMGIVSRLDTPGGIGQGVDRA